MSDLKLLLSGVTVEMSIARTDRKKKLRDVNEDGKSRR
jgi:hypothetical protein